MSPDVALVERQRLLVDGDGLGKLPFADELARSLANGLNVSE
jgi:hypothetical protein